MTMSARCLVKLPLHFHFKHLEDALAVSYQESKATNRSSKSVRIREILPEAVLSRLETSQRALQATQKSLV